MSSDMLLSPVSSSTTAPTSHPQPPPLVSLPVSHSTANACFPALPFVAYSSSSRSRCSACHQPILLGDIRVDCLHLDCVSSAHVSQWLSSHPQLARSFMRLPSLSELLPEDRKRAALLLHTLAQQCMQRASSPPANIMSRPPLLLQPLSTTSDHLPSILEDSVLSPPRVINHLPSPSRLFQRQRTAPNTPHYQPAISSTPTHPYAAATLPTAAAASVSNGSAMLPSAKRKRVASDGSVQVVDSSSEAVWEWGESNASLLLSPAAGDTDSAMAGGGGGSGRKKRRRSRDYVSMLT